MRYRAERQEKCSQPPNKNNNTDGIPQLPLVAVIWAWAHTHSHQNQSNANQTNCFTNKYTDTNKQHCINHIIEIYAHGIKNNFQKCTRNIKLTVNNHTNEDRANWDRILNEREKKNINWSTNEFWGQSCTRKKNQHSHFIWDIVSAATAEEKQT